MPYALALSFKHSNDLSDLSAAIRNSINYKIRVECVTTCITHGMGMMRAKQETSPVVQERRASPVFERAKVSGVMARTKHLWCA